MREAYQTISLLVLLPLDQLFVSTPTFFVGVAAQETSTKKCHGCTSIRVTLSRPSVVLICPNQNSQEYLHAMTLVKREMEAWSGKGDVMTREGNASAPRPPLTSERKKMVQVGVLNSARLMPKVSHHARTKKGYHDEYRRAKMHDINYILKKENTGRKQAVTALELSSAIKRRRRNERHLPRSFLNVVSRELTLTGRFLEKRNG